MSELKLISGTPVPMYVPSTGVESHHRSMVKEIFTLNIYDQNECPIPENGVVIDTGGNVGLFSYVALEKNNKVICLEPAPINLLAIYKNIGHYPNLTVIEAGAWSEIGTKVFSQDKEYSGGSRIIKVKRRSARTDILEIKVVTIDSIVNEKLDQVDFIKFDIEGSELEALKGASDTIKKYKPNMAICLYHRPSDIEEIPKFVTSLVSSYKVMIKTFKRATKIAYFY